MHLQHLGVDHQPLGIATPDVRHTADDQRLDLVSPSVRGSVKMGRSYFQLLFPSHGRYVCKEL
jgi:hypothetical protein